MECNYLPNKKVDPTLWGARSSRVPTVVAAAVVGLVTEQPPADHVWGPGVRLGGQALTHRLGNSVVLQGLEIKGTTSGVWSSLPWWLWIVTGVTTGVAAYLLVSFKPAQVEPTYGLDDSVYYSIPATPVDTTAVIFLSVTLVLLVGYITGRARWALAASSTVVLTKQVTQAVQALSEPFPETTLSLVTSSSAGNLSQALTSLGRSVSQTNGLATAVWVGAAAGVAVTVGAVIAGFWDEQPRPRGSQGVIRLGHNVLGGLGIGVLAGGLTWVTLIWMGHVPSPFRIIQEVSQVGQATTQVLHSTRPLVRAFEFGSRMFFHFTREGGPSWMLFPFVGVSRSTRRWMGLALGAVITFLVVDHFFLAPYSYTYPLSDVASRPKVIVTLLQDQVHYLTAEYEFLKTRPAYQEDPEVRAWIDNHYRDTIEFAKAAAAGGFNLIEAFEKTQAFLDQPKFYIIQGRPSVATRMARFVAELIWR